MTNRKHDLSKAVVVPSDLHRELSVLKAAHGFPTLAAVIGALGMAARGQGPLAGRVHAFDGTPSAPREK